MFRAESVLQDEIAHAAGRIGGQLAIFCDGDEVLRVSTGWSGPSESMSDETLHSVWCATKVIFHTAALHGLWEYGLSERSAADLLPAEIATSLPADIGRLTPSQLLSHRISLPEPHVMEVMHLPPQRRREVLLDRLRVPSKRGCAGTYAPSKLLELMVSHSLGVEPHEFVTSWCASHLAYAREVRFNLPVGGAMDAIVSKIGPYALTRYRPTTYSYHDRVQRLASEDRLAIGGFVTMRALAEFYSLLSRRSALPVQFLDWLLGQARVAVFDDSLDMKVQFLSGFNAEAPGFQPGGLFVGMSGLTGSSFGFALPGQGVAAAFMVNEMFQSRSDIDFFRLRMLNAIVADVGMLKGKACP